MLLALVTQDGMRKRLIAHFPTLSIKCTIFEKEKNVFEQNVSNFNNCIAHLLLFCTTTNKCKLTDKLLYCSYMFRHNCVILRELVVSPLLRYTSTSMQLLAIQFKISHVFYAVEISTFKIIKILKLSYL